MQAVFWSANGLAVPITQNLGSIMPMYQCVLADGMIGPGNEAFMDYAEKNHLGYILQYKWFDFDAFSHRPRRVAVVFQFNPERLEELDPPGCKRYEKHNAKLLRQLYESQENRRRAG